MSSFNKIVHAQNMLKILWKRSTRLEASLSMKTKRATVLQRLKTLLRAHVRTTKRLHHLQIGLPPAWQKWKMSRTKFVIILMALSVTPKSLMICNSVCAIFSRLCVRMVRVWKMFFKKMTMHAPTLLPTIGEMSTFANLNVRCNLLMSVLSWQLKSFLTHKRKVRLSLRNA